MMTTCSRAFTIGKHKFTGDVSGTSWLLVLHYTVTDRYEVTVALPTPIPSQRLIIHLD